MEKAEAEEVGVGVKDTSFSLPFVGWGSFFGAELVTEENDSGKGSFFLFGVSFFGVSSFWDSEVADESLRKLMRAKSGLLRREARLGRGASNRSWGKSSETRWVKY